MDAMLGYFGPGSVYEEVIGYENILSEEEIAQYQAVVDDFMN